MLDLSKMRVIVALRDAMELENYSQSWVAGTAIFVGDYVVVAERWAIPLSNIAGIVLRDEKEEYTEDTNEKERVLDEIKRVASGPGGGSGAGAP